ncbi:hypothetical protein BVZ56_00001B, partial [Haemophilus influenzae]
SMVIAMELVLRVR